jgi:hypothetical protein
LIRTKKDVILRNSLDAAIVVVLAALRNETDDPCFRLEPDDLELLSSVRASFSFEADHG